MNLNKRTSPLNLPRQESWKAEEMGSGKQGRHAQLWSHNARSWLQTWNADQYGRIVLTWQHKPPQTFCRNPWLVVAGTKFCQAATAMTKVQHMAQVKLALRTVQTTANVQSLSNAWACVAFSLNIGNAKPSSTSHLPSTAWEHTTEQEGLPGGQVKIVKSLLAACHDCVSRLSYASFIASNRPKARSGRPWAVHSSFTNATEQT